MLDETPSTANASRQMITNEERGRTKDGCKRREGPSSFLTNGQIASGEGRALYVTLWGTLIANESPEKPTSNPRQPFEISRPTRCQQRSWLASDPPTLSSYYHILRLTKLVANFTYDKIHLKSLSLIFQLHLTAIFDLQHINSTNRFKTIKKKVVFEITIFTWVP